MVTPDSTPRHLQRSPSGGLGIVGPCGAGKTTLVLGLKQRGVSARQIAQEHSHVQDMWRRLDPPLVLIFLDASFEACTERKHFNWPPEDYREQQRRLDLARRACDIYIETDGLTPQEVVEHVMAALGTGQEPDPGVR